MPYFVVTIESVTVLDYETLYAFVLATAALALSPGPDIIYVLLQSMFHGRKYGLATTAGLMAGCLVHTSLLAFGVSAIIRENESLFLIIKIFGALYLFYLAFMTFRGDSSLEVSGAVPKKGLVPLFRQGFIMNVLNPKVALFFLAFFPAFLFSQKLGLVAQFYILGTVFIVVSFGVFGTIALLSASISRFLRTHSKTGLYLKWLQILVYVGIGLYILLSDK